MSSGQAGPLEVVLSCDQGARPGCSTLEAAAAGKSLRAKGRVLATPHPPQHPTAGASTLHHSTPYSLGALILVLLFNYVKGRISWRVLPN